LIFLAAAFGLLRAYLKGSTGSFSSRLIIASRTVSVIERLGAERE